ncbi:MAG: glycosyltransferase [bacterium]
MTRQPEISVIILTGGRLQKLKQCLSSLCDTSTAVPHFFEIIVAVNGRDRPAEEFIKGEAERDPRIRPLFIDCRRCRGEARNSAIDAARGKFLLFLDDDITVPDGFFSGLLKKTAENTEFSVFGGSQDLPLFPASAFQTASNAAFSSVFGGGIFRKRYGSSAADFEASEADLCLCNLAIRREILEGPALRFEGHLTSGEENLLLARLSSAGVRMLHCAELAVFHERRVSPAGLAGQVFKMGMGRAEMTGIMPGSLRLFACLPAIGLALVCVFVFLGLWRVLLTACAAYAAALGAGGARFAVKEGGGVSGFFLFCVSCVCIHVSYGAGFLWGAGQWLLESPAPGRKKNRRCVCEGTYEKKS